MTVSRPATATSAHSSAGADQYHTKIRLRVNGNDIEFTVDNRASLLDTLREQLELTGTKKGCDHGQCGACTVHVNGRRVLSCLSLTVAQHDQEVRTIEGLCAGTELHPMQQAFVDADALQCGFCTPGQIMSATAMLDEAERPTPSHVTPVVCTPPAPAELSEEEIRERMSGNICRCGAYQFIVDAIKHVRDTGGSQ
jgi:xanthine dehydrogenase YagT iron-sulfur-binding subunit